MATQSSPSNLRPAQTLDSFATCSCLHEGLPPGSAAGSSMAPRRRPSKGIEKLPAPPPLRWTRHSGVDLSRLTVDSLDSASAADGEHGRRTPAFRSDERCVGAGGFASNDRHAIERAKDIGKVLTAIETIDAPDRLEELCKGIANRMRSEDADDEDIEETVREIMSRRNRPGDQIREFLDFLDDEALARVRLQVTMGLMDALAVDAGSKLTTCSG